MIILPYLIPYYIITILYDFNQYICITFQLKQLKLFDTCTKHLLSEKIYSTVTFCSLKHMVNMINAPSKAEPWVLLGKTVIKLNYLRTHTSPVTSVNVLNPRTCAAKLDTLNLDRIMIRQINKWHESRCLFKLET